MTWARKVNVFAQFAVTRLSRGNNASEVDRLCATTTTTGGIKTSHTPRANFYVTSSAEPSLQKFNRRVDQPVWVLAYLAIEVWVLIGVEPALEEHSVA